MKFGHNFDELSIPQWRSHNIDYNHLKEEIRKHTDAKQQDTAGSSKRTMGHLNRTFVDDFDRVSLFTITKYGELSRRLAFQEMTFSNMVPSSQGSAFESVSTTHSGSATRRSTIDAQIRVNDILYQCYEVSNDTQALSKFILMQKIASRKILKKLQKHHPDKKRAAAFVNNLKEYLYANEHSFFNLDMSSLTLKLSELIRLIKEHRGRMSNDLKLKNYSPTSAFVTSMNKLAATNTSPLHVQQKFTSIGTEYDLAICIKKNFHVDCIIPDETNMVNETILNLNVNLGLDVIDFNQEVSFISILFLQTFDRTDLDPSYIISDHSQDVSTIVAFTGGLRKYAYCVLPNDVVQQLLDYLSAKTNDLKEYFHNTTLSSLTRLTIETIIKHKLSPKCRVDFQRHRYIMRKEIELTQLHHRDDNDDVQIEGKNYEDDYYVTLDKNIQTTTDPNSLQNLDHDANAEAFDIFPYAHLMVHSNDSNLSNFSNDLETPIGEGNIGQTYSSSLLRKLPVKIQDLLTNNNSVTPIKGLSFYRYALSCYYNIPVDTEYLNSHYSFLLNLNLLKNYEKVENFRNQRNAENRIQRNNSLQILHHQHSLKSLSDLQKARPPPPTKNDSMLSMATTRDDLSIFTHDYLARHGLLEELLTGDDSSNEENNDFQLYLKTRPAQESDETVVGDFVVRMLRFKSRVAAKLRLAQSSSHLGESSRLQNDIERNYGSVRDSSTPLGQRKLQRIFQEEFDHTLSYFYFSLFVTSLFVSGVELGIVYSLVGAQGQDSKLLLSNNLLVVLFLLMGLMLSLIFAMISINLNLRRYYALKSHTVILWLGSAVVVVVSSWSVVVIMGQG